MSDPTALRDLLNAEPMDLEFTGSDPNLDRSKVGRGRNRRFHGDPKPDYRLGEDWRELFDPDCDCGMCPEIPCPNRENARFQPPKADAPIGLEEFLRRCRVPLRFRGETFGTWIPDGSAEPRDACRRWLATWPPAKPFALLQGNPGLGKTHMAVAMLRENWEQGRPLGQFWSVPALLDRYRATQAADSATESLAAVDRELENCPLLVLDDFGKQRSTEFADERLYGLVDARYTQERPTIFTSNVTLGGDATADRVAGKRDTLVVAFSGVSRRRAS